MIKDEMINANVVANYFLTKSELTPKKLQKLVYYSYSWFIALNNENENEINSLLFDETPEAWIHGPVFKSLYSKYKILAKIIAPIHPRSKMGSSISIYENDKSKIWPKNRKEEIIPWNTVFLLFFCENVIFNIEL